MRLFDRLSLIFYANFGLFVYSLVQLTTLISSKKNGLSTFFRRVVDGLGAFFSQFFRHFWTWQNLLLAVLFLLVLYLLLRFWRVTFIMLEILTLIYVLIFSWQLLQKQQSWASAFYLAVMVIALVDVWVVSKQIGWIKN